MKQIIVCPNQQIGKTVINYIVEFYDVDYYTVGGVKAANGWHVQPTLAKRTAKKPFLTNIVSNGALERYLETMTNKDDTIERW